MCLVDGAGLRSSKRSKESKRWQRKSLLKKRKTRLTALTKVNRRSIRRRRDSPSFTSGFAWSAKSPAFPKPVKLGAACTAWRSDELAAWMDSRPRASLMEGVA